MVTRRQIIKTSAIGGTAVLVPAAFAARRPAYAAPRPPESWETGFKDTVLALPGEITRLVARAGRYVWHGHIVDHEDNEMMRPIQVVG